MRLQAAILIVQANASNKVSRPEDHARGWRLAIIDSCGAYRSGLAVLTTDVVTRENARIMSVEDMLADDWELYS